MAKSLFEELDGKYERQGGDYLIPCITVPAEEEQLIGIWGMSECRWHSSCEPTETAAFGLSEAATQSYIHQSSHKRQAQHLLCQH